MPIICNYNTDVLGTYTVTIYSDTGTAIESVLQKRIAAFKLSGRGWRYYRRCC